MNASWKELHPELEQASLVLEATPEVKPGARLGLAARHLDEEAMPEPCLAW